MIWNSTIANATSMSLIGFPSQGKVGSLVSVRVLGIILLILAVILVIEIALLAHTGLIGSH